MLLATFNLFQVPYSVAFASDIVDGVVNEVMNWIIDLLFMLDVVINFRTTIVNEKTGEDIIDDKIIAMRYLKGKFWVDILASIPFDFIELFIKSNSGFTFQMFGLLKLIRILRLSRLITYMNIKDEVKMSLKLFKLVFFLIMYLHVVG